jgi:hypothetical protein
MSKRKRKPVRSVPVTDFKTDPYGSAMLHIVNALRQATEHGVGEGAEDKVIRKLTKVIKKLDPDSLDILQAKLGAREA